jgi:hypothetical protein
MQGARGSLSQSAPQQLCSRLAGTAIRLVSYGAVPHNLVTCMAYRNTCSNKIIVLATVRLPYLGGAACVRVRPSTHCSHRQKQCSKSAICFLAPGKLGPMGPVGFALLRGTGAHGGNSGVSEHCNRRALVHRISENAATGDIGRFLYVFYCLGQQPAWQLLVPTAPY